MNIQIRIDGAELKRSPKDDPLMISEARISAANLRAALLALRAVKALRITVHRCSDLLSHNGPPTPYIFYTSKPVGNIQLVEDTTVYTRTKVISANPAFDSEPRDHSIGSGVVTPAILRHIEESCITFIVFDHLNSDPAFNLGVAEVPLKPLLMGPTATIVTSEKLHPQGSIEISISWVM